MSDGKKYDGSKARATFNGREMTGIPSSIGESPEPVTLVEVGQVLTVIHEDGRREPRRVVAIGMVAAPNGDASVTYVTEPVEEP